MHQYNTTIKHVNVPKIDKVFGQIKNIAIFIVLLNSRIPPKREHCGTLYTSSTPSVLSFNPLTCLPRCLANTSFMVLIGTGAIFSSCPHFYPSF